MQGLLQGAVAKITGKEGERFEGKARVFNSEEDSLRGILTGAVKPGDVVTYTLVVTNSGSGTASGVVVSDPVPADMVFRAISGAAPGTAAFDAVGNRVVFNVGDLASGASATLTFTATVQSLTSGTTPIPNPPATVISELVTLAKPLADTVAILVTLPDTVGMAVTLTVPEPPGATDPMDQLTVPLAPTAGAVVAVGLEVAYTQLAGNGSDTTTVLASAVPVF